MEKPRKPAAGFWIVVGVVAMLVGYPLSIGPVRWIVCTTGCRTAWLDDAIDLIYAPVLWVAGVDGAEWLSDALLHYLNWWYPFG